MGMLISRSAAAIAITLIMTSAPDLGQTQSRPPVAPEH
jgi:hypothetical protein